MEKSGKRNCHREGETMWSGFADSVTGNVDDGYVGNSSATPEYNGDAFMGSDEGVALREWRRENAIRLEKKEKMEKDLLSQIVAEAEDYKVDFHSKRKVNCETTKVTNREKEKIVVASIEKVHAEADKNYWKTIAELIPKEVPAIANKREKKGEEKKPSISVVKGPKPGKPTELSRMRHLLLKLKHEPPSHLKLSTSEEDPAKDPKAANQTVIAA